MKLYKVCQQWVLAGWCILTWVTSVHTQEYALRPLRHVEREVVLLYPRGDDLEVLQHLLLRLDQEFGEWAMGRSVEIARTLFEELDRRIAHVAGGEPDEEGLARLLFHDQLVVDMLFGLISRWPQQRERIVKARAWIDTDWRPHEPSVKMPEALQRYYQDEAAFADVDAEELLGEFSYFWDDPDWLVDLLDGLAQQDTEYRQSFMEFIQESIDRMARLARWDFLHRFPGASGIRLSRGSRVTEGLKPGMSVSLPRSAFFSHVPTYWFEVSASSNFIIVADVPIRSIRLTSWVYYEPNQPVYEPEIVVSGAVAIARVFDLMTSGQTWVDFADRYSASLRELPGFDERDFHHLTSARDAYLGWRVTPLMRSDLIVPFTAIDPLNESL